MEQHPEELQLESGKWSRRDVFVANCAAEWDEDEERVDEVLEEMIEDDGVLRSMKMEGTEYVQLTSQMSAMSFIAKNKPSRLPGVMRDLVGF